VKQVEYIYSALLLHSAGKEITEEAVTNVLKAAGIEPDSAKVKALVASLKEVNIEEAIQKAAVVQAAPQPVQQAAEQKPAEEEKPKEEEKTEEEAVSGLSALFG
jgi:large subunit ribosomal protein L12